MDKKLLLLGGTVLIAGGLAYWFLKQQNGNGVTGCSRHTNQTDCEANGCYWHSDGTCKSYPEGYEPCSSLTGIYGIEGWQKCDRYNNLCRYKNNNWTFVEANSKICLRDIYYWKCGKRSDGYVGCMPNYDWGIDECEPPWPQGEGFGQGCSCTVAPCDLRCWCETYDKECVLKAPYTNDAGLVNAIPENMTCWDNGEGSASYCQFLLPKGPWAASKLQGTLYWKWGAWWPGEGVTVAIFAVYKDRIQEIFNEHHTFVSGDTGQFMINADFPMQGIDALVFAVDGVVSNIHVDYFIGNLI